MYTNHNKIHSGRLECVNTRVYKCLQYFFLFSWSSNITFNSNIVWEHSTVMHNQFNTKTVEHAENRADLIKCVLLQKNYCFSNSSAIIDCGNLDVHSSFSNRLQWFQRLPWLLCLGRTNKNVWLPSEAHQKVDQMRAVTLFLGHPHSKSSRFSPEKVF